MSRGLRNNNPGNIRLSQEIWKGEIIPSQDKEFKQFEDIASGYRAMFRLIHNYATRHRCNTIRKIIERWAPTSENDTKAYIETVSRLSGIMSDTIVTTTNRDVMIPIVSAMSRVENGVPAIPSDVTAGWNLFFQKQ